MRFKAALQGLFQAYFGSAPKHPQPQRHTAFCPAAVSRRGCCQSRRGSNLEPLVQKAHNLPLSRSPFTKNEGFQAHKVQVLWAEVVKSPQKTNNPFEDLRCSNKTTTTQTTQKLALPGYLNKILIYHMQIPTSYLLAKLK